MKIVTYFKCEVCGNEYATEELARACEASRPECSFKVGDKVFYQGDPSGSFSRAGGQAIPIRELQLTPRVRFADSRGQTRVEGVGHYWRVRLGGVMEPHGAPIETTLYWIDPVDGPYCDRSGAR